MNTQNNNIRVKLRLLGKIASGDKVSYKSLYIQKESITTKCYRSIYGEDRKGTLLFIENTINQISDILKSETDENVKKDINEDLNTSVKGLTNLIESYHDDIQTVSAIENYIRKIEQLITV